jgi:DNA-directed RNA polymerase subunit beta
VAAIAPSRAPRQRRSYARLRRVIDVPNLIDIQVASFRRFMEEGLREVIDDISPIEDYTGTLAVEFGEYAFDPPPVSIRECREKDLTYSAPLSVTVRFINKSTGEIREQRVFMGDFPLMTEWGTFIINGTERVVVTQLVRSPGAYILEPKDAAKQLFTANLMPSRGSWLELEIDKKGLVTVRIDRKRKLPITTLLRALPHEDPTTGFVMDTTSNEAIVDLFRDPKTKEENLYIGYTLEKDITTRADEALIEVFKKQRPGEPPTLDNARALLRSLFFDPKRYDLTKVGRYKLNLRLHGWDDTQGGDPPIPMDVRVLTTRDILTLARKLVSLPDMLGVPHDSRDYADDARNLQRDPIAHELDEYEHFGNRRLRDVGELIQEAFRIGLYRMERVVRERMTTEDVDTITPQTIINIRPVVAALKEFFGSSQLSQFMDQTNSLAGLTHRRRLSALGAGGLTRERAPIEVRDVHATHYGRMCPIETPEGPNIGLIGSLSSYATVSEYGFIQAPYRKVVKGKPSDEIIYLDASKEERHVIAQSNADIAKNGKLVSPVLVRRRGGEPDQVEAEDVDYMDVAPEQIVSVATALIPFLEHNDANRALMGSNMQRQAVPLMITQAPYVGTGLEFRAAVDTGDVVLARRAGKVALVDAERILIETKDSTDSYDLIKYMRSNQGTLIHQKPIVFAGQKVAAGDVLADGSSTDQGELALGKNLLVAFMSWEGYNFEDAIILSERLVKDDVLTSIHIHEYEIDARSTKLGDEEITRDIPNRSEESLRDLDEGGIVRIGAEVRSGDLLVGKVTPKGETELTAEEKLIRAIFKEKAREVRDTSLKVPHGEGGKVIDVKTFSRARGDDLSPGVNELVRVYVATKRKISEGDKLAGRHGNKGVISKIVPEEDLPYLADGRPVDIILNPLGVPSRMNVGQILETHLGWAAAHGGDGSAPEFIATPVFDGATPEQVDEALVSYQETHLDDGIGLTIDADDNHGRKCSGRAMLHNGRTGEEYDRKITVGYLYVLKLLHLVDDKIHARSTGPYSLVTQQPLGGKAQFGGQRFGEMEVWALEAYGAAYTLQEMLTVKSDDTVGRVKAYEAIVKGENIPEPSIPESFKVLLKEMQSLALDVNVISEGGGEVQIREEDDELLRAAEELGIDISPGSLRAQPREPEAQELEEGAPAEEAADEVPADEVLNDVDDVAVDELVLGADAPEIQA